MSDTPSPSVSSRSPHSGPALPGNQFPVLRNDWLQLRRKVANLKEPVPYLASVSWTCVGITATTLLALIAWLPVDSALPNKAHIRYTFVMPLLIITVIAGIVVAIFTFAVVHQTKQIRGAAVDEVLADMATIYEPYSHTGSGRSA